MVRFPARFPPVARVLIGCVAFVAAEGLVFWALGRVRSDQLPNWTTFVVAAVVFVAYAIALTWFGWWARGLWHGRAGRVAFACYLAIFFVPGLLVRGHDWVYWVTAGLASWEDHLLNLRGLVPLFLLCLGAYWRESHDRPASAIVGWGGRIGAYLGFIVARARVTVRERERQS